MTARWGAAPPAAEPDRGLQQARSPADKSFVERRFDHRYLIGLGLAEVSVRITDLARPDRAADGQMTDISESGMGLTVPFELAAGDIVQLELEDSRLYGIVVHASQGTAPYRAGVELQRVLIGGSDLSRVLHRTLRQVLPDLPGVVASSLPA